MTSICWPLLVRPTGNCREERRQRGCPRTKKNPDSGLDCRHRHRELAVFRPLRGTVGKSPDQATYLSGATVSLTAMPATGRSFGNWSGDASGSANPLSVTMDAAQTTTALLVRNTYAGMSMVPIAAVSFHNGISTVSVSAFEMSMHEITQSQHETVWIEPEPILPQRRRANQSRGVCELVRGACVL
jgi:hypothetical protein